MTCYPGIGKTNIAYHKCIRYHQTTDIIVFTIQARYNLHEYSLISNTIFATIRLYEHVIYSATGLHFQKCKAAE